MVQQNHPLSTERHENLWSSLIDPLRDFGQTVSSFFSPTAEASDSKESYEINLELPGVTEDDIDISLEGDMLIITGEKKVEREEKEKDYYFSERRYGKFQRSFRIPANSKSKDIKAQFADGVLTLTIPKSGVEEDHKRKIEIQRN